MTCPTCNSDDPKIMIWLGSKPYNCPDPFHGKGVVPSEQQKMNDEYQKQTDVEADCAEPTTPADEPRMHNPMPPTEPLQQIENSMAQVLADNDAEIKGQLPTDEPEIAFDIEGKPVDAKTFLAAVDAAPTEKPEHQELRDMLYRLQNRPEKQSEWVEVDEALAAINARFEAALGEDEPTHGEDFDESTNHGRLFADRNKLRAEARKRWYGDTKGGTK